MKIIDNIKKSIATGKEMDKKSSPSTQRRNIIGLFCTTFAALLLLATGIALWIDYETGIQLWLAVFYFAVFFALFGMFLSLCQRLRGQYFSSNISLFLGVLCILAIVALVVVQAARSGQVYIFPFNT